MHKTESKIVLPGSFVANEEEFMAGRNVFSSRGVLYSDSIGVKQEDMAARILNVKKLPRAVEPLDLGSVVIGVVERTKEQGAFIKIVEGFKGNEARAVTNSSAMLPIFNIANFYVNDIKDMLRIGDVIKARVVEITPYSVVLSVRDEAELGVLKAFCSKCRNPLSREGSSFKCSSCGNLETRKASADYSLI